MPDEDQLILTDAPNDPELDGQVAWRVLVVDDDEEVHRATDYAFRRARVLGRNLILLHTYSGAETRALLAHDRDFALVLLDVVMEDAQAGLNLVEYIRRECQMLSTRIILRTGQPGSAPELPIIEAYDINDYRTKSELTQTRLITAVTAALRSFDQIRMIAESRRGLELIVRSSADLMERHAMLSFAEGVLTQLAALLGLPRDGLVCVHRGEEKRGERADTFYVISAGGQLADYLSCTLDKLADTAVREAVTEALRLRQHQFGAACTVLYLSADGHEAAVYMRAHQPLAAIDRQLVEVFATNLSAYFGNVHLIGELNRLAFMDGLTGLANRVQFVKDVESLALAQDAGQGPAQAVLLLDVRRFSELNNGLGHEIGNAYLKAIAAGLRASFSAQTRVARLSGDVFGLVGPVAELGPEQSRPLFEAGVQACEHRLPVAFAAGYYALPGHQGSGLAALRRANIALARARLGAQAQLVIFDPIMEEQTAGRLALLRALRAAIQAQRLELWYQPQLGLQDGRLVGLEALMRWPDGAGGMVESPAVFVPLAEQAGLIVELGLWALHRAAQDWRYLQGFAGAPPRISVNVSMPQFRSGDLQEQVAEVQARHALPAGTLELEITESIAMDEPALVVSTLVALREQGVRVALDDFGTGYSSLSQLSALPIDALKIDRAFVSQIGAAKGEGFVETVLALGQHIGAEIIAEGVETPGQAEFLRQHGCPIVQGWLYAKAMPLEELKAWMSARA
ncbi:EAL domain-containing protein [Paucibacter sp. B2R-40]|uniref:EAL domain-containing protein n=1 Tax=Paucibacter sp. B2R-40 TaxID=2893554 RepID=UPI0021E4CF87|nr:EAL domain-containing protein [Paucibacter sp. B2R-40]MCV2354423.1 EAL domain-containing protein [Paucibacter sp. B2R-40]